MWRGTLDKMVKNLQTKGVEDTPYQDKNWRKLLRGGSHRPFSIIYYLQNTWLPMVVTTGLVLIHLLLVFAGL